MTPGEIDQRLQSVVNVLEYVKEDGHNGYMLNIEVPSIEGAAPWGALISLSEDKEYLEAKRKLLIEAMRDFTILVVRSEESEDEPRGTA